MFFFLVKILILISLLSLVTEGECPFSLTSGSEANTGCSHSHRSTLSCCLTSVELTRSSKAGSSFCFWFFVGDGMKAESVFLKSASYLKSVSGSRICFAFFLDYISFKGTYEIEFWFTRLVAFWLLCAKVLGTAEMIGCSSLTLDIGFEWVKSYPRCC